MSAVGYAVRSMVVDIDGESYECAVTKVGDTPAYDTVTTETACPGGSSSDVGPTTWTLDVEYNISNMAGSLHRLLRENAGEAAVVTFTPFPVQEPTVGITYDVTLVPGSSDYTVGAFGAASVSLPVQGEPTYIAIP